MHKSAGLVLFVVSLASGCASGGVEGRAHGDAGPIVVDGAAPDAEVDREEIDAAIEVTQSDAATVGSPPGSRCACDEECAGDATHPGVCVYGVCMTRPTATCASSGSRAECGDGSRCWLVRDTDEHVCWPDCDAFSCAGTCDADGSCVGRGALDCDPACGSFCYGTPRAAPDACPDWRCEGADCDDIVLLPGSRDATSEDALSRGYYIDTQERYAYVRRDLSLLLQYAACEVARRFPGTAPLGIQDLSQADGDTPGTDAGRARHPSHTHHGNDLDLSYYQTDGDNDSHIVCGDGSDTNGNGHDGVYNDGYFCTTEQNIVDWPREAYFFAMLASTPLVRIFGLDTTFVDDMRDELDRQLELGWITSAQHERANDLGWGSAGGWQYHHHHSHMSYLAR